MYHNCKNGDRFVGAAAPFLLGALTGGVTYAAFNPYRPRPVYPYYGGYGYGGYGYNYYPYYY